MSKLIYSVLECTISQDSIRESPLEASTQAHTRQPHQEATDSSLRLICQDGSIEGYVPTESKDRIW